MKRIQNVTTYYAVVNSISHAILHIAMRCDNVAISALAEVRIEWLQGLFTDGEVRAGMGMCVLFRTSRCISYQQHHV